MKKSTLYTTVFISLFGIVCLVLFKSTVPTLDKESEKIREIYCETYKDATESIINLTNFLDSLKSVDSIKYSRIEPSIIKEIYLSDCDFQEKHRSLISAAVRLQKIHSRYTEDPHLLLMENLILSDEPFVNELFININSFNYNKTRDQIVTELKNIYLFSIDLEAEPESKPEGAVEADCIPTA